MNNGYASLEVGGDGLGGGDDAGFKFTDEGLGEGTNLVDGVSFVGGDVGGARRCYVEIAGVGEREVRNIVQASGVVDD